MDNTIPTPPGSSPTTPQTTIPTQPTNGTKKSSALPWVISGILFVTLLLVGAVAILLISTGETSVKAALRAWLDEEETSEESEVEDNSDGEEFDDSEDPDYADDSEDVDIDADADDDENDTEVSVGGDYSDLAEGWSDYYNEDWYFGFKYPGDLIIEEDNSDPSTTYITVKSGGNTDVVTIWVQSSGIMDNLLSNMLTNQCTDDITYSNIRYGIYAFRKATEIPMEGCLEGLGITRDQELAAYGVLLPGEVILTIRNDALNQEQLQAFLSTVYAD